MTEGGKLLADGIQPPMQMKPLSMSHFYIEQLSADIDFASKAGRGMKVTITQPGGVDEGTRTENVPNAASDLAAYIGTYWSDELETQYTFSVVDGKLRMAHIRHGIIDLVPTAKDSFSTDWWFTPKVEFLRDKQGNITAVNLGGGRTRAIRFVKK